MNHKREKGGEKLSIEKRRNLFKAAIAVLFVCCLGLVFSTRNAAAAEEVDVTTGWEVLDYKSSLKIPIEDIFVEGASRPGTDLNYASVGFSNIGRANLTMQKVIPLKAGKTYHINLTYGMHSDENASGFIDFNGVKKESLKTDTTPELDKKYSEVLTPAVDQDYVITMSFNTPAYKEVFLMVGYDSVEGGFKEATVEKPVVTTPEAWTSTVSGGGTNGNTIKVMDSSGQVVGETVVGATNEFTVKTTRELAHNEVLSVIQVANGVESEVTYTTVKDTIKPNQPIIQAIHVDAQLVIGSAEANSKVTVKDKNGEVLGEAFAAADGTVSFVLTTPATLNENVFVTATDAAGNVSDQATVSVFTDAVTEEPKVEGLTETNNSNDVLAPTEKAEATVPKKEQTQKLPHTGENKNASLFTLAGVLISVTALLLLKYKQRGEHPNDF